MELGVAPIRSICFLGQAKDVLVLVLDSQGAPKFRNMLQLVTPH
jgi:hypothetical protein